MAFLGLFNYTKPGPGVDKGETNKNRFFYFLELYFRKFWKLIELNLLYLITCIPIVTIGPATAGFVYVLRNYADVRSTFLVYDFFSAFKKNFKQSFLIFLVDVIASAISVFSAVFYYQNSDFGKFMFVPFGIAVMVILVIFFMRPYAYLMAVTVDLKFKHIIKNAFILAFLGLKTNFITLFFTLILTAIAVLLFPVSIVLIALILVSTIGFIAVYNSYQYIVKYIVTPTEESGEEALFTDIGTAERPAKGASPKRGRTIK